KMTSEYFQSHLNKKYCHPIYNYIQRPYAGRRFSPATVDSEKGASHRKRPDGKLPAGNHRQFRCYCPLEPLRKVCILAVLTEGQRFRVTVSGNRFLAEFRRATEYQMTPTDRNTPFDPS